MEQVLGPALQVDLGSAPSPVCRVEMVIERVVDTAELLWPIDEACA